MSQAVSTDTASPSGVILLTEESAEPRPPRRGFLKTLITAPIAAVATHKLLLPSPTAPIVTPADAAARLKRGLAEAEAAFRDLFPGVPVSLRGNCLDDGPAEPDHQLRL